MIERRYPIQSVLAERKMFANGGMVSPPMQQPMQQPMQPMPMQQPMQPMQPQQPQQPQGIMASSQPLVDAIAADALNPQGGGTLSGDDGTLSMAQGGAVGFANGGIQYDPTDPIDIGGTPSERLQMLFPRERGAGLLDQFGLGKGQGETYSDEPSITRRIAGMVPGRVGTALEGAAKVGEDIGDVVDSFLGARFRGQSNILGYLFSEEEEASGRSLNERYGLKRILSSISPELKQQNPNIERDLLEIGANLVGKTGSQQEFEEAVANQYANQQEAGYRAAMGDVNRGQVDAVPDEGSPTVGPPAGDEEQFYNQELSSQVDSYRIAMADGPEAQQQFAQELSANPGYPQEFKDAVLGSADVGSPVNAQSPVVTESPTAAEGPVGQGPFPPEDAAALAATFDTPDGTGDQAAQTVQQSINENQEFSTGQDSTLLGGAGSDVEILQQRRQASSDNQFKLFQGLLKYGKDAPPGAKADAVTDVASSALKAANGDKSVDIEKLKSELEALIPAVEENDPQTEGMLLVMLGAAIAGGESSNWVKNVADGVKQGLPDIIKYREKQKSAQKQRDMSIAKMAISQKFSLEAEQRALSRTIGAEDRALTRKIGAEDRAQKRKDAEVKTYVVTENKMVDASSFDPKLTGQLMVPSTMMLQLDTPAKNRLAGLGISLALTGPVSMAYDDIFPDTKTVLTSKQMKNLGSATSMQIFRTGKNPNGFKLNYQTPSTYGMRSGLMVQDTISSGNWNVIRNQYVASKKPIASLLAKMEGLRNIDPSALVGTGAIVGRIGSALRGLGAGAKPGDRGFRAYVNDLGRDLLGGDISKQSEFEATGRLVLAQITPMILGESGRTISDQDRARVAKALGFNIEENTQGGVYSFTIVGRQAGFFKNPSDITDALEKTASILKENEIRLDDEFSSYVTKFAVNLPKGATAKELQAYESSRKATPSPLSKKPGGLYFNLKRQT